MVAGAFASALARRLQSESRADPRGVPASPDTAGMLVTIGDGAGAARNLPAQLYVEHDAAIVARSAGVVDSVMTELGAR